MYIVITMNSTSTMSPLMAGAARLAKELAGRKAEANAVAVMPGVSPVGAAADTLDVSRIKQFGIHVFSQDPSPW